LTGGADAVYTTVYDSGMSTITANGHGDTVSWSGSGTTTSSIASALASTINADSSASVTASASGATVNLTAKTTGSGTNYSLSSSSTYDTSNFSSASFSSSNSGSTLTGGANSQIVYDTGSVSVTVNGFTASTTYGQTSNTALIAAALATGLNGASSPVSASASGGVITLAAKAGGSAGNDPLSTSVTYDTTHFSSASFTTTPSGNSLTGGLTNVTGLQNPPSGCLASAVCYTPQGTFYALSIGQSPSFTGVNLTHTYNNRLQPLEFKASSSAGNAIDINYSFIDSVSGHNGGHAYSITNNLDSTRSQTFTYDQLNRITSALTTSTYATSPAHCWGEMYGLDAWGNLNSIAATTNSNYTACSQESGFATTADGNNHLPSWAYDASGNATSDGAVTNYVWDAESQLKSAAGVNYAYDGDGRRVAKVGTKLYWYGSGGDILAETDTSGNTTAEYIFFGGKRIAMIPAGGTPVYYVEDMLGTSRILTTNAGVVCYDADFYPYGGERSYTNTCPQNYKFEGKERDTETGNDDFGARYYSNRFGRWLSADWSAIPAPIPYANLTNPQTLNLYSMVSDDPESFADLDGHYRYSPTDTPCTTGADGGCGNTAAELSNTQTADSSFLQTLNETAQGAVSAWAHDNGAPLQPQGNDLGQAIGHIGALVQGLGEMALGGLAALGGGTEAVVTAPAAATGVGTIIPAAGVGVATLGAAVAIHGAGVTGNTLSNIYRESAAKEGSTGGPSAGKRATPKERSEALKENGGKCVFCGKQANQADHAVPRSRNGNTTKENLQPTCAGCNQSKGAKTTQEFLNWLKSKF
jgi:RHS repeat-associated protein